MSDIENISEQLSAYLDGELTQSQARRVAAALAENPELTAELEELRKTRSLLRDLPRRCVGDDFAAKVLHEANRRGFVGRPGAAVRRPGP
ncbi:MAG: zf-HC2 domain-containing protein, partial [Candidatus Hydrogenedentes bacterium]|nr:zf-HC2 domain-containing protein [Candidatus Hydrogenedentota bacterium]